MSTKISDLPINYSPFQNSEFLCVNVSTNPQITERVPLSAMIAQQNGVSFQVDVHSTSLSVSGVPFTSSGTVVIDANNASTLQKGLVQLYDSDDSTSTTLAATANSVNAQHIGITNLQSLSNVIFSQGNTNSNNITVVWNDANSKITGTNSNVSNTNIVVSNIYNLSNTNANNISLSWNQSNNLSNTVSVVFEVANNAHSNIYIPKIEFISANVTLTVANTDTLFVIDTYSGNKWITLPNPTTLNPTWLVKLKNHGNNVVYVNTANNVTIDDFSSIQIGQAQLAAVWHSDTDNYHTDLVQFGWDDYVTDIITRGTGGNDPTWTQIGTTNFWAYSFSATTMQQFWATMHITHTYAMGTKVYPHIHWFNGTAVPNSGNVVFGIEYTVAKGFGQEAYKFAAANTTTVYIKQNTDQQYKHMVAEVSDANAIPANLIEPDTLIAFRVFRDAANSEDTCTNSIFINKFDCHYQTDKTSTPFKAPNFFGT
jgi:hypothetical protein